MLRAQFISRWFFGLAIAIALTLVWVIFELESENLQSRFLHQARMISNSIAPELYYQLKGTDADQQSLAYQRIKDHLKRLTRHYPDIDFTYLYALRSDGQVVFLVDNEPVGSRDEVLPGVVYEEINPQVRSIIENNTSGISPVYTDRWGTWISAVIPKERQPDADLKFFFAADIKAEQWRRMMLHSIKWPLTAGGILLLILLARWVIKHHLLMNSQKRNAADLTAFFLIGCLLTFLLVWMIQRLERQKEFNLFSNIAETKSLRVENAIRELQRGFFFPLSREIARSDKDPLTAFEDAMAAYKLPVALDAVGWLERVPRTDLSALIDKMQTKDPSFEIWEADDQGSRKPLSAREQYFPLLRVLPGTGSPHPARGFDEWSEPNRRAAIQTALLTNELSFSAPVALVYMFDQNGNLTCFFPVRDPDDESLIGLLVASVLTDNLMEIFHSLPDAPSIRDASEETLFFEKDGSLITLASTLKPNSPPLKNRAFTVKSKLIAKPLHLGGQTLLLEMTPGVLFEKHFAPWISWTVGTLGGLVSMASTLGLAFLFRHREQLETEVSNQTRELQESEARFRQLFEESSEAYIWVKGDLILKGNQSLCRMLRCSPEDLAGSHPWDFSPEYQPDGSLSRSLVEDHVNRLLRDGRHEFEFLHQRMDGSTFWAAVHLTRIDRENGPLIFGSIRDISKRKKSMEDNERLHTALEQADESVVITDINGIIEYVNPAFERTTGYSREEALNSNPSLLKSGQHPDSFYKEMWDTLLAGKKWQGHMVNRAKDGSLFHEQATVSPVRDKSGKIKNFIAVKRNITRELELQEQFLQSQKMETVGQLAGGVAHDFNNVLQVIMGYARLAETQLQGHSAADHIQKIIKAGKQAAGVTRQLLIFSRSSPMKFAPVNINEMVEGMLKMVGRLLGEHIDVRIHLTGKIPQVVGDTGQLEQCVLNLCVNARDAMPGGGSLEISTGTGRVPQKLRERFKLPDDEMVFFSIEDTGTGIPASNLPKIFEPFYTSKKEGKGTGLGLASVHGIVEQHHGAIDVKSTEGKGTSLTIYLPVSPESKKMIVPETRKHPLSKGKGQTILLADDYDMIRSLSAKILEKGGYQVLTASDGKEAIDLILDSGNDIDLVVSDLIMPNGGGREILKKVRETYPDLPFIFISGYDPESQEVKTDTAEDETIELLKKPFQPEELLRLVHRVFKQKPSFLDTR